MTDNRVSPTVRDATVAVIKSQQLAGHFPDRNAIARGVRVYKGEITGDEAVTEIIEELGLTQV